MKQERNMLTSLVVEEFSRHPGCIQSQPMSYIVTIYLSSPPMPRTVYIMVRLMPTRIIWVELHA